MGRSCWTLVPGSSIRSRSADGCQVLRLGITDPKAGPAERHPTATASSPATDSRDISRASPDNTSGGPLRALRDNAVDSGTGARATGAPTPTPGHLQELSG